MKSLTDLAGNLDASAAQVLTALRIVAARADVEEIVEWAAKELEGYQEEDELPAHRIWHLSITASLHNPHQGLMNETHLGDFAIDAENREKVTVSAPCSRSSQLSRKQPPNARRVRPRDPQPSAPHGREPPKKTCSLPCS